MQDAYVLDQPNASRAPTRGQTRALMGEAVYRNKLASKDGVLERVFALAFTNLVYPQIWEDPDIDMAALEIAPDSRIVTIASGGCNILSYLTARPESILAVDLNPAHVALARLKLAAARHLPAHGDFHRFFGNAAHPANVPAYERFLRPHLDAQTLRYWDGRTIAGSRRVSLFGKGFYRYGLLGRFIGLAHGFARIKGIDFKPLLNATSIAEQRAYFDKHLAPLFDNWLLKAATGSPMLLYGLGIPPAQFKALANGRGMASVLRERLEKLTCAFPIRDNYFAWQAFARSYDPAGTGPLPPYLKPEFFETVRDTAERAQVFNVSYTALLAAQEERSLDRYVLLDAQDWMCDDRLNELWRDITRTARPGARVIFRTAAEPTFLPGRVEEAILSRWQYLAERSAEMTRRDRSAIYGGFHLYVLKD